MKIVVPAHFDHVFNAPSNWVPSRDGECVALPVQRVLIADELLGGPRMFAQRSFWRPSTEELEILNAGGVVGLDVLTAAPGGGHPVVRLLATHVEEQRVPKEIFGG